VNLEFGDNKIMIHETILRLVECHNEELVL